MNAEPGEAQESELSCLGLDPGEKMKFTFSPSVFSCAIILAGEEESLFGSGSVFGTGPRLSLGKLF